jgi:hypothetical protein
MGCRPLPGAFSHRGLLRGAFFMVVRLVRQGSEVSGARREAR